MEVTLRSPLANPARDRSARIVKLETIEQQTWKPKPKRAAAPDLPRLLVRDFGTILDVR